MARFVDLEMEDDGGDSQDDSSGPEPHPADECTATPTVCNAVTRAFQCYPIAFAIVSSIDLTTLDSLARTSRMIHHGLVQYRVALMASTLRCANEKVPPATDRALRCRAAHTTAAGDVYMDPPRHGTDVGKMSLCARDMVGECRRCATVICRNCAIKPPAANTLRDRHRRLCASCSKAPLQLVACPNIDMALPMSADIMQRSLCNCHEGGVWFCQPCGRTIRNMDHDYLRIWRWRNHYGEVLGCLGTGIGDADRGVICGREGHCLAAREREQETDCDAEDARGSLTSRTPSDHHSTTPSVDQQGSYFPAITSSYFSSSSSSSSHSHPIESLVDESRSQEGTPSPLLLGPGYERHEIEGIGGIVKRKLVRMVRVGKCVPEWEEERSSSRVMGREARGEARSWCGWCWRVVPGRDDILTVNKFGGGGGAGGGTEKVASPLQCKTPFCLATQSRPPITPVMCIPMRS